MEDIAKISTVVHIILFLIPGFVANRVMSTVVTTRGPEEKTWILSTLITSAWLYAFASPIIYLLFRYDVPTGHPKSFAAASFAILFAYPIAAGYGVGRVLRTPRGRRWLGWLRFRHPTPRAWDDFFGRQQSCIVLATLDDGTMVGGLWHGNESFSSSYPDEPDLYLSIQFRLDDNGGFLGPVEGSKGCYLEMSRVRYLEFYEMAVQN